jgi:hypothetical protein
MESLLGMQGAVPSRARTARNLKRDSMRRIRPSRPRVCTAAGSLSVTILFTTGLRGLAPATRASMFVSTGRLQGRSGADMYLLQASTVCWHVHPQNRCNLDIRLQEPHQTECHAALPAPRRCRGPTPPTGPGPRLPAVAAQRPPHLRALRCGCGESAGAEGVVRRRCAAPRLLKLRMGPAVPVCDEAVVHRHCWRRHPARRAADNIVLPGLPCRPNPSKSSASLTSLCAY